LISILQQRSQQVAAILADFWSRGVVIIGGAIVAAS
jgi:hypothetical protein